MSTKIYTKTGDHGDTGLIGGFRVSKNDPRIQAYGEVDELNSFIGRLISEISNSELKEQLETIQHRLFNIGSLFACTSADHPHLPSFDNSWTTQLEQWMDRWDQNLPTLKAFILPGGHPSAATAHMARTVCRRAERSSIALVNQPGREEPYIYINRLSDYLFVVARICNHLNSTNDIEWHK